jgi:Fur family transcriptional regulator, ferric uptake regulator
VRPLGIGRHCGRLAGSGRRGGGRSGCAVTVGRAILPPARFRDRMQSDIERLCSERGLKMTGQRRVIAQVLSESGDHPDVEELYRRAAARDPRISIATVYRTVRLFEERGILERRDFGGSRARYEPTEHGHHHHLIDIETGRVFEFSDPEHERMLASIASKLGFDLVSHRLELYGRRRTPLARVARQAGETAVPAAATLPPGPTR